MEKYRESSAKQLINSIPTDKPAVVLLRLWDQSEQEVAAIQRQTQKRIRPKGSEKTIESVRYGYD